MRYDFKNNTYFTKPKDDPKDRVEIEIGDSKQPDFKPQFKLMRWDNEVNFSIRAVEKLNAQIMLENDVVIYKTDDYEVHQYDRPDASREGGFEFEWLFKNKPTTNIITATVQSKGLTFHYQPALTQEEIAEGIIRPDNVIGSYAAYYQNVPKNIVGEKIYRTGKAFHIYRPKVKDNNGNEIWADLHIANGLLTVTIPQEFLDTAIYPIIVDPTFGYTTVGGTEDGNNALNGNTATLSETANLTTIHIYTYCDSGTHTWTGAVYADSTGVPGSRLAVGSASGNVPVGIGNVNWVDSPISGTLSAATLHPGGCYDVSTANLFSTFFDTTTGINAFEIGGISGTPPDPFGAATTRTDRSYSLYVDYTTTIVKDLIGGMGIIPFAR